MAKSSKQKKRQRLESRPVTVCIDSSGLLRELPAGQALEVARTLAKSGHYGPAAELADAVANQVPAFVYPLNLAADCYLRLPNLLAAERSIDAALGMDKTDWSTLRAQASLYRQLDRYDDAISVLTKAIKIHPRNEVLYENFGNLWAEIGDYEKAAHSYSAALKCNPQATAVMRLKTDLPGVALSTRELGAAEKMLRSADISHAHRRNLHFAIAQTSQQAGDSEAQIQHLHAANKAHRATVHYDVAHESAMLDFVRSSFKASLYSSRHEDQQRGDGLIFIVGMPRSGSSLVEQILSSHPEVSAAGESNALSSALNELAPGQGWMAAVRELFASDTNTKLEQLYDSYLSSIESFRTRSFMTDKTLGNYYFLGLIPLIFPAAKIIHTFRNPVDNCFGCYRRLFNGSSWSYTYNLEELATAYTNYQDIMRHWRKLVPNRVFNFEYEDLVAGQQLATSGLLAHCGLDWNDRCLDFASNTRAVRTNSLGQVRSGLHAEGMGQWQVFRESIAPIVSLQPFTPEEVHNQISS